MTDLAEAVQDAVQTENVVSFWVTVPHDCFRHFEKSRRRDAVYFGHI